MQGWKPCSTLDQNKLRIVAPAVVVPGLSRLRRAKGWRPLA
jgi:hypothetical protein